MPGCDICTYTNDNGGADCYQNGHEGCELCLQATSTQSCFTVLVDIFVEPFSLTFHQVEGFDDGDCPKIFHSHIGYFRCRLRGLFSGCFNGSYITADDDREGRDNHNGEQ